MKPLNRWPGFFVGAAVAVLLMLFGGPLKMLSAILSLAFVPSMVWAIQLWYSNRR